MRLSSPRIQPVALSALSPEQQDALAKLSQAGLDGEPAPVLNIFRTLAHAPKALAAFLAWGSYVLSKRNALPARDREIVILRIGFLCRSGYEWTQHVEIGLQSGLSAEEIARIKLGPDSAGWSAADSALLRAADELHRDQFVSDATWVALSAQFSAKACMDAVFTAGQYTQVCMMLNTFGVQLDEGQTLDPELKGY